MKVAKFFLCLDYHSYYYSFYNLIFSNSNRFIVVVNKDNGSIFNIYRFREFLDFYRLNFFCYKNI